MDSRPTNVDQTTYLLGSLYEHLPSATIAVPQMEIVIFSMKKLTVQKLLNVTLRTLDMPDREAASLP